MNKDRSAIRISNDATTKTIPHNTDGVLSWPFHTILHLSLLALYVISHFVSTRNLHLPSYRLALRAWSWSQSCTDCPRISYSFITSTTATLATTWPNVSCSCHQHTVFGPSKPHSNSYPYDPSCSCPGPHFALSWSLCFLDLRFAQGPVPQDIHCQFHPLKCQLLTYWLS